MGYEDAIKTLGVLTDRATVSDWRSDLCCKGLSKGRRDLLRRKAISAGLEAKQKGREPQDQRELHPE